jgi:hypothetical protein
MSDPLQQAEDLPRKSNLREAIRRVRLVNTEQADGLADLRDAEHARLELLADSLSDLFAEVPDDLDFFAFALSNGETPRLWIDMTCHVAMGRDRRTYRLLKDTRLGRTVLYESTSREDMTDRIADYVAERVLDRQRAIEGDWIELRTRGATPVAAAEAVAAAASEPLQMKQPEPHDAANEDVAGIRPRKLMRRPHDAAQQARQPSGGSKWAAFTIGLILGVGAFAGWMIAQGKL